MEGEDFVSDFANVACQVLWFPRLIEHSRCLLFKITVKTFHLGFGLEGDKYCVLLREMALIEVAHFSMCF